MVHRKNLWPSEFEATFPHRLREHGCERIVSCSRLPDCHGEECGAVTNASMRDQSWRRRDWGTASPAFAILLGRHRWRPVHNRDRHTNSPRVGIALVIASTHDEV